MACHCHEHEHCHEHQHDKEQNILTVVCIVMSAILLLSSILWFDGAVRFWVCIAAYLLVGFSVLKKAFENIFRGEIFDENFLMAVASIGAFCIGEYHEAVAVMLLYQLGEMLQGRAVASSRKSIRALMAVRPDTAKLENGEELHAEDVAVGTLIVVQPGERVPLDGIVRCGRAMVDTSALTGESLPREWSENSTALAGCIVQDGALTIEVTKPFGESSVSRIMELVEDAQEHKARPEQFITRFARVYTPAICAIALVVAVLPPLLDWGTWSDFIHKALTFLVISCPCALVISVPLSFFSGIGCAGHHGILIKGGNHLEMLSRVEQAAFDKTGTLTTGKFTVRSIHPTENMTETELLELAALAECRSTHPLAKAIVSAYGKEIDYTRLSDIRELSGHGVEAVVDGKRILAGKSEWIGCAGAAQDMTTVYVSCDGQYCGHIVLCDSVKPDTKAAIAALRSLGIRSLTMLSGDKQAIADDIAQTIGLDGAYGQLLPEDKVTHLQALKEHGTTLYAGDGINDAPVLAAADVAVAMGGLGSDAAIEAADVVIMSDEIGKIALGIRIARKTMNIAKQNIVFSIAVKVIILTLSLALSVPLWLAVFADVGVCMLAVLNSLRTLRIR